MTAAAGTEFDRATALEPLGGGAYAGAVAYAASAGTSTPNAAIATMHWRSSCTSRAVSVLVARPARSTVTSTPIGPAAGGRR